MNNDLRKEMEVILGNENVCDDCSLRIVSLLSNFLNNELYIKKIKESLDLLLNNREIDFWSEYPKIIFSVIEINKNIVHTFKDIDKDYMKFVIYGVIYNYLETEKSELLNSIDQGTLRCSFLNILPLLLTKPKKLIIKKQSIFSVLLNCLCGDDGVIRI